MNNLEDLQSSIICTFFEAKKLPVNGPLVIGSAIAALVALGAILALTGVNLGPISTFSAFIGTPGVVTTLFISTICSGCGFALLVINCAGKSSHTQVPSTRSVPVLETLECLKSMKNEFFDSNNYTPGSKRKLEDNSSILLSVQGGALMSKRSRYSSPFLTGDACSSFLGFCRLMEDIIILEHKKLIAFDVNSLTVQELGELLFAGRAANGSLVVIFNTVEHELFHHDCYFGIRFYDAAGRLKEQMRSYCGAYSEHKKKSVIEAVQYTSNQLVITGQNLSEKEGVTSLSYHKVCDNIWLDEQNQFTRSSVSLLKEILGKTDFKARVQKQFDSQYPDVKTTQWLTFQYTFPLDVQCGVTYKSEVVYYTPGQTWESQVRGTFSLSDNNADECTILSTEDAQ